MIAVFFVVSGYSISTSLTRARNERPLLNFYCKLTSSILRRPIWLYYPVLPMVIINHILFYIGTFDPAFDKNQGCHGAEPWGSPMSHVKCLVISLLDVINPEFMPDYTLNNHFWTIPTEFRGSTYIYLISLALATSSHSAKYLVIGILSAQSLWMEQPHYTAFLFGFLFAELDALTLLRRNSFGAVWHEEQQTPKIKRSWFSRTSSCAVICTFVIGVFLICLPVPSSSKIDSSTVFPIDWTFCQSLPW